MKKLRAFAPTGMTVLGALAGAGLVLGNVLRVGVGDVDPGEVVGLMIGWARCSPSWARS